MKHLFYSLTFSVALFCPLLHAQELDRVMPEPVPQLVPPAEAPEPAAELEAFRSEFLGASGGETVLVVALNGVILLEDEAAVDTVRLDPGETSNLSAYPEWDDADFREVIDLFVGLPVSKESLERLQTAIRLQLSALGRPFSVVYTPPQDITDGIVQLVIKESTVGQVRVAGANYFSEESYLSRVPIEAGGRIDLAQINRGVDRINANPFRSAALGVERGAAPATTDIVIQARERRPIRVFAGYNNMGSQTTKEDRVFAGFNWGNAFGQAHQMTLQWTSDPEARYSRAVSGNYTADLPRNHSITLFGAYSEVESIPQGPISQEGTSWQAGINYTIPLETVGQAYSHSLQFGVDFKYSDNNIEFAQPPFIFPLAANETNVAQIRAKYSGTLADDWGSTRWGISLTASPGGLSSKNDDQAFSSSRAFAEADYLYGRLDVFRDTDLRGSLAGWRWTVRGELQLSNRNLLGSEVFSAGGSQTVRGYEENEVLGDNGILLSQELLLPVLSPSKDLVDPKYRDTLQLFVFQDYARTWNVDTLPGEKPFNLLSYGVGLRYQFSQYATLNLAHGWQARDSGSSDTGDNRRLHLSFQISY